MPEAACPYCDEKVRISGTPKIGQKVTCPYCGESLEVIETHPPELDFVLEDEEYEYEYDNTGDDDEYY